MKVRKYISILLNSLYILILILFLLEQLTSFEIKIQQIKTFTYIGLLILAPSLLLVNCIVPKSGSRKIIASVPPVLTLMGIGAIGPTNLVFASSPWKTQTILYQSPHWDFLKVEFQMQDAGALGYNQRTVEVFYLTDAFMVVRAADQDTGSSKGWIKADTEVNELRLTYP